MTKTPLLPGHAKALTRLLLAIRPDWNESYTFDAVAKMRDLDDDLERIVRVAVRGALSPKIAKPDVLAMTGEHWKARADEGTPGEPERTRLCHSCGNFHRPSAACLPPAAPGRVPDGYLATIREQLARTPRPAPIQNQPDPDRDASRQRARQQLDQPRREETKHG